MLEASSRVGLGPRFARFASSKGKNDAAKNDAAENAKSLVSRPSGLPQGASSRDDSRGSSRDSGLLVFDGDGGPGRVYQS